MEVLLNEISARLEDTSITLEQVQDYIQGNIPSCILSQELDNDTMDLVKKYADKVQLSKLNPIMGSFKISESLLYKLISKRIKGVDGKEYNGASSFELATILYFSQISDSSGSIKNFRISSLSEILRCSRREAISLMNNLVLKGYITILSERKWAGYKDIKINNNDFSKVTNFKKHRYMSTQYSFFNPSNCNFQSFMSLSLFAKRTLLLCLYNYNFSYGWRVSYDNIKSLLGVQKRGCVENYLNEISLFVKVINELSSESNIMIKGSDASKRLKYGSVFFKKREYFFLPTGLETVQDTFFKREWLAFLANFNITSVYAHTRQSMKMSELLNELYSIFTHFLIKNIPYEKIKEICIDQIISHSSFDKDVLFNIRKFLDIYIKNPQFQIY